MAEVLILLQQRGDHFPQASVHDSVEGVVDGLGVVADMRPEEERDDAPALLPGREGECGQASVVFDGQVQLALQRPILLLVWAQNGIRQKREMKTPRFSIYS